MSEVTIHRNDAFYGFEGEESVKVGTNYENFTVKASADLAVKVGLCLDVKMAGVNIDVGIANFALKLEGGHFFGYLDNLSVKASTASSNAVLAEANILLNHIQEHLTEMDKRMMRLESLGVGAAQAGLDLEFVKEYAVDV